MSYFMLKYGFTSLTCCDEPTPGCADIWPRHRNHQDSISVTMLRVRSKFFRKIWQNSKHDSHLEGSWPIGVHFRWPCLSDLLCMVGIGRRYFLTLPPQTDSRADWQHKFLVTGLNPLIDGHKFSWELFSNNWFSGWTTVVVVPLIYDNI